MELIELTDWTEILHQNPGTPPWWVLAVRLRGETRTTHRRVFAAIDPNSSDEPVRVLVAVEYGDAEGDSITPWSIDLRVRREGVSQYRILGASKEELIATAVGPSASDAGE